MSRYWKLNSVLEDALDQASVGKGHERHDHGGNFEDQFICEGGRYWGWQALLFQAEKKLRETKKLSGIGAKRRELLGVINYVAACVILLDEMLDPKSEPVDLEEGIYRSMRSGNTTVTRDDVVNALTKIRRQQREDTEYLPTNETTHGQTCEPS